MTRDDFKKKHPAIWQLVIKEMQERDRFGRAKYKHPLTGMDEFDGLTNAYEEALDLVCYLRKAIYDRDFKKKRVQFSSASQPKRGRKTSQRR